MPAALPPIPVDIIESGLDALAVWAALGAAVVTAVTAVLIWLQIRQTKRSVEATERTLELAMAEQEQSRQLIVDARKARIDAELPKLLVWVHSQSAGAIDPTAPDDYEEGTITHLQDVPEGRVWSLSEDRDAPLVVRLGVNISNDGPRRAHLRLLFRGDPSRSYEERVIEVGGATNITLERSHTIGEWAAIASHDYSPLGDTGEHGWNWDVLTVTYIHQGTEGAIERWVVRQGGSPLRPVSGEPGRWMLGPVKWNPGSEGGLNAGLDMPSRDYYSSMAEQRRLE